MKILILGNCQGAQAQGLLDSSSRQYHTDLVMHNTELTDDELYDKIRSSDYVFARHYGEYVKSKLARPEFLKSIAPEKTVIFPNILYRGFTPHISYLGSYMKYLHGRYQIHMYDFIVDAYLAGTYFLDVARMFDDEEVFMHHQDEDYLRPITDVEHKCDLKMSDYISDISDQADLFCLHNHPTTKVIAELTDRFLSLIGEPKLGGKANFTLCSALAGDVIGPTSGWSRLKKIRTSIPNLARGAGQRSFDDPIEIVIEHYRVLRAYEGTFADLGVMPEHLGNDVRRALLKFIRGTIVDTTSTTKFDKNDHKSQAIIVEPCEDGMVDVTVINATKHAFAPSGSMAGCVNLAIVLNGPVGTIAADFGRVYFLSKPLTADSKARFTIALPPALFRSDSPLKLSFDLIEEGVRWLKMKNDIRPIRRMAGCHVEPAETEAKASGSPSLPNVDLEMSAIEKVEAARGMPPLGEDDRELQNEVDALSVT